MNSPLITFMEYLLKEVIESCAMFYKRIKTINIFILLLPVRQGSTLVMVFGTLIFRDQVLSRCLTLLTEPMWQSPAAGCSVLTVQKLKQAAATQKVCVFVSRFQFFKQWRRSCREIFSF